ncbi:hypothetical protein QBC34DRAFT_331648 [Podospora aff. communis PSN243]|uniref:Allergen n=1 Tax=Podospora aff. communis PSN243 TaxID=3040156 RepID=A0AAV9GEP5_9PEZI|nr:hypothetical protein QBC34DRAFT_331648 [Podospora aff. communis PSN243]
MDRAKAELHNFMSGTGRHDTSVQKQAAPAVTQETVKPSRHEEVQAAVNREVHQDHHHRVVQPIQDREVLPEQHVHNAAKTVRREFDHRDHDATERALKAESAQLRDQRVVAETSHTQSRAPAVQGETVHHHVHETVQRVIHKETIQPQIVHTTVPVHEVHHEAARHHGTTTLPAMTMDEFKRNGGALGGRDHVHSETDGCPPGAHGGSEGCGLRRTGSSSSSSDEDELGRSSGHGIGGAAAEGGTMRKKKKASLIDKLNPMKDADGDGKKGFMS